MYKKMKQIIKKSLACICIAAMTLTVLPADGLGSYSPTIEVEAAEADSYVVADLQAELGVSVSFETLMSESTSVDLTERQKATKGFVDEYGKKIIFDQATNAFYYASGSKTKSDGSIKTFRTAGYELTFIVGGTKYSVAVIREPNESNKDLRGGENYLKDIAECQCMENGTSYTYNLFRISVKDLTKAFDNRDLDFASIFYSSSSSLKVTGDAYLINCVNGIQQAWIKDKNGDGIIDPDGRSGTIVHKASDIGKLGISGISTENYFGKIMYLKPNAYNVYTDNVKLTDGSTSGAYYPAKSTTQSCYYINGNVNSSNKYYFKFTGTTKKAKNFAVDEPNDTDYDLIFSRLDITTRDNLNSIYNTLYSTSDDGALAANRLINANVTKDGVASYAVTVESESEVGVPTKYNNNAYDAVYSSNAKILSSAKSYSVTTSTSSDNRTNTLEMKAGFTVKTKQKDDAIIAITPYVKAMKSPTNTKGISSDRYDKTKALYLIADITAPERADTNISRATENNVTYYRFKVSDSGSGIKSASLSGKSLSIMGGNSAVNYGITRNTSAYVYIKTSDVTAGTTVSVTLTDNVGNQSTVSVDIPGCGLFYWDRGELVDSDISATKSKKFTIKAGLTRKYYTFTGWRFWDTDDKFPGVVKQPNDVTQNAISGYHNLDAQWTANTYTVVFHSNAPAGCSTTALGVIDGQAGFDKTASRTVQFSCERAANCEVSLPGYTFQGWYGDEGCTFYPFGIDGLNYSDSWQEGSQYGIEPDINGQIHLYAKWEAANIGIYFDLNKPTSGVNHSVTSSSNPAYTAGSSNYIVAKFDSAITGVPNATLTGWHDASTDRDVLVNWFQNAARSNTGACLSEGSKLDYSLIGNPDACNRNVTFYAQWDPNTYAIYYISNAPGNASTTDASIWGWSQEPQTMTYDVPANLTALDLTTPSQGHNTDVLPGYTWKHWTLDNGNTYQNQAYVQNLTTTNHGTVALYAQWTPNTYTVYYNANKPNTDNNTHAASGTPMVQYGSQTSNDKIAVNVTWDSGFNGKVPTATLTGWHGRYDADGVTDAWYMGNTYTNPGNRVSNTGTFNYGTVGYPGDKNVYAQWQANWYYICYHENGQGSVTKGSIQNEKSLETQVKEQKKYMTEYAYTNTFEKCIQSSMRNSKNTRIHIYDVKDETAGSQFIRYDDGVAGEQQEHYSNNEKKQLTQYSETDYEKYGLPNVTVSYLNHNTTWNTKYDYDFLGWDMGTAYKDDGTHRWNYNAGAVIKNLTTAHRGSIDMYAFWNAFPNYDAVKDTTHFSVYEGADITMQMLKDKMQVWDKEQENVSDVVVVEEITYKDGSKVTKPAEDYLLDTSAEKIGAYTVTFSVTDNRGDKTYLTGQGNIVFNNEPVIADLDGRFLYLEDIKDLTPEQKYELLMRPVVRTDVEDDAYEAEEFLQKDDLFLGKVEAYTGFGQANWYQEITASTKVYKFTENQKQEGLKLLHEDMKTLTQTEADNGKTFIYVCYTNDIFKKQADKNDNMTIVDTANDDVIPENTIRRCVRFINSEFLSTLPADWQGIENEEKRKQLEESLEKTDGAGAKYEYLGLTREDK